jgi:hypothetical protein
MYIHGMHVFDSPAYIDMVVRIPRLIHVDNSRECSLTLKE